MIMQEIEDLVRILGLNSKYKKFIFIENGETVFKHRKLIKNYFNVTGEDSKDYNGKIRYGKLYLSQEQIRKLEKINGNFKHPA